MKYTQQQYDLISKNMIAFGGSFFHFIGQALVKADADNTVKLETMFADTFEKYLNFFPDEANKPKMFELIIDECELHDEEDEFFNIHLDRNNNIFYAQGMSTGKVVKFKTLKTPEQLNNSERYRVLEYNLGRNYEKNLKPIMRDIFMQSEFVERIN